MLGSHFFRLRIDLIRHGFTHGFFLCLIILSSGCSEATEKRMIAPELAPEGRFPSIEQVHVFEPVGETNVRSSFRFTEDIGFIGTEETGDIFKTVNGGLSWRKVWDGGERWEIADVRNFIRAQDGHIYITTTEPGTVSRSMDEGESWDIIARAPASRTVGLIQLESGDMLVGLRRSDNGKTSILRSRDHFRTFEWLPISSTELRQNVTTFGHWGGSEVLAGVGFEGPGKIYKSKDNGLTWSKKAEFPDARDLMNFFKAGDDIYVLASGIATLYKSSDDGETWSKARQFWEKGFLGQCVPYELNGRSFLLMTATDQTKETYRHLVLISDDAGKSWFEWLDLLEEKKGKVYSAKDSGGGASNIAVLSKNTIVVGVGNHAVQGRAFTIQVSEPQ
jgi:photosystem II stability/assembly factor-like uncharacterized protein